MIETTIREPEKHDTITADSQGRVNLGVEYAGRDVEIVVAESAEHDPEKTGLQQTIDRPMTETERKGMLFVRAFGIAPQFLKDEHTAVITEDGVDPETVIPSDINWSFGYLQEPKNVARFVFESDHGDPQPWEQQLTTQPTSVVAGDIQGDPVYRFENEQGETSAIGEQFVERVQQLFGYDPETDHSNVRVNPADAPHPVMFRDPESDAFIAIAPRVTE